MFRLKIRRWPNNFITIEKERRPSRFIDLALTSISLVYCCFARRPRNILFFAVLQPDPFPQHEKRGDRFA